jgi:hypothetical protein
VALAGADRDVAVLVPVVVAAHGSQSAADVLRVTSGIRRLDIAASVGSRGWGPLEHQCGLGQRRSRRC